jgi:hypothetical protein
VTTVAFHLAAMKRAADCDPVYCLKVAISKSNRDLMRRFR